MEALPIYLDKLVNQYLAIILSATFVLVFGEVIPQAACSRYGLAISANLAWLVRILTIICYPIAYPIGKMLDWVLGHNEVLFRQAQLKALVSIHGQEISLTNSQYIMHKVGNGGELTHDETTIIRGALDLTEKIAGEAMSPIESTFSLDVNSKLDWESMGKVLAHGHSLVPVYSGNPKNIIGLLLVKSLLTVRPKTETPIGAVSIRRIPRVPSDMPLYDILNEFQKGSNHMAAVVKAKDKSKSLPPTMDGEKIEKNKVNEGDSALTMALLNKQEENSGNVVVDIDRSPKIGRMSRPSSFKRNDMATYSPKDIEEGEEEIVDEIDEYIDVHKRLILIVHIRLALLFQLLELPSDFYFCIMRR